MRQKVGVGFIIAGILYIVLGYFPRVKRVSTKAVETVATPKVTEEQKTWGVLPRTAVPAPDTVSQGCKKLWAKLRSLDLSKSFGYPPSLSDLSFDNQCESVPDAMKVGHDFFVQACVGLVREGISEEEWMKKVPACQSALFIYRAQISHYLTLELKPQEISDPILLWDKLNATLTHEPGLAAQFAERLLEINPEAYFVAKGAILARLSDAQASAPGRRDSKWDKLTDAIDRARRMKDHSESDLVEVEVMRDWFRGGTPDDLRRKAETVMDEHPELSTGPYFLAWSHFLSGDKESAERAIKEYLAKNPGDSRFLDTLDKIQKGDKAPFTAQFSFGAPDDIFRK